MTGALLNVHHPPVNSRHRTTRRLLRAALPFISVALPAPLGAQQDTTQVKTEGVQVFTDTTIVQDTTKLQDAHPQDSPEDRGFLIVTANQKSQLRIRGSLRVNGAYDLRGLQNTDAFSTYDIPVGDANKTDPRFFMSANQTRLGLEVTSDTPLGEVFLKMETDFRGQGNTARLRHAYASLDPFLAGLTWSVFGDLASLPLTVDLDGPNSSVAVRTIQVRYTAEAADRWRFAVSVESPSPEIGGLVTDSAQVNEAFQATPDIVARGRRYGGWGHTQLAMIFRTINTKTQGRDLQVLPAFGGLFSGRIRIDTVNVILFQLVAGSGVSRFITALEGRGLDVVFNPSTGDFETLDSAGGYLSYGHSWKVNLETYVTAGAVIVDEKEFAPPDAFDWSAYASTNLFWEPTTGVRLGGELAFGQRVNIDGQTGGAVRFSFIGYFDF